MKTKLKSLLAGLLVVASGYSLQANALPNETFSFHQHTGFVVDPGWLMSTTGANNIGWYQYASTPNPPPGEYNTIAWGVPVTNSGGGLLASDPFVPSLNDPMRDLSGLRVIGYQGTFSTGATIWGEQTHWGNWATISTIYHQNRPIYFTAATLLSAVVFSDLIIDHSPEGDIFGSPNGIQIGFRETFNALPCLPEGNPNGSVCDDVFAFPAVGFAPVFFNLNGHWYEIEFGLANFQNSVTDFPLCNANPGSCTVWTAEGVTSSMDVVMRIREIPEPASLLLVSLGLLGLGFGARRKLRA